LMFSKASTEWVLFRFESQIHSEYVVKFYGLCLEPKLTLVIEYCSRGSLYDVMNDPTIESTYYFH
jgi:serine/threonine protein kinase